MNAEEIKKREEIALSAIKSVFATPEQKDGVTLFIEHHIEELEPDYWEKHLGTTKPEPKKILNLLVLRDHWDDDTVFDFTLPEDVTDYVISVHFDEKGEIDDITMES